MPVPSRWAVMNGATCVNIVMWDGDLTTWNPAPLTAVPYNPATHIVAVPVEQTNTTTLRDQAVTAMALNRAYIALVSPTAAETTAHVKRLARQNNALIRLVLGQLDGTD